MGKRRFSSLIKRGRILVNETRRSDSNRPVPAMDRNFAFRRATSLIM